MVFAKGRMVRQTQQFRHDLSPNNKKDLKINVCNHLSNIYFLQNHKRKMKKNLQYTHSISFLKK